MVYTAEGAPQNNHLTKAKMQTSIIKLALRGFHLENLYSKTSKDKKTIS